jgi:hypothetical protein
METKERSSYEAPKMEAIEMEVEGAILVASGGEPLNMPVRNPGW